jgi:hypothetical protein
MLGAPVFRTALFGPWSGNALWTAARAVPSLDLCFADKKDLICASSSRQLVTFARASSGTYTDSAGVLRTAATDVPRFDHNPLTGESPGLLVEEQRTNLLIRSEEFDNAPWNPQSAAPTVTANTAISPSGTLTADTITFAAADSRIQGDQIPVTAGVSYTFSVYVKAVGVSLNKCRLAFFDGAQQNSADFTVSNLTWTRISNTFVAASTALARFQIRNATDVLANSLFFWGAQLEAGATASSYIPTTTAAATRNADVAQITGTNFSSWYRQDEGTVYAEYIIPALIADGTVTSFDDGTANNRWQQRFTTAGQRYRLVSGGVSLVDDIGAGVPLVNATNKVAHTIRSGDQRYAANGALNTNVLTASPLPAVTQLQLGAGASAGNAGRIIIRRLTYWPQRLPNGTLQAITQ